MMSHLANTTASHSVPLLRTKRSSHVVPEEMKGGYIRRIDVPFIFRFISLILAIDCGPLPDPMNGSSIGDLTVFPNIIRFSCEPGFFLNGSSWRECQANGTWSGNETTCNRQQKTKTTRGRSPDFIFIIYIFQSAK